MLSRGKAAAGANYFPVKSRGRGAGRRAFGQRWECRAIRDLFLRRRGNCVKGTKEGRKDGRKGGGLGGKNKGSHSESGSTLGAAGAAC